MLSQKQMGTIHSSADRQHLLHIFPSFGIGGVPLRMARIINHFGKRFRHTIVALNDDFSAAASLAPDLEVTFLPAPRRTKPMPAAILDNAITLRRLRPDLLLTYNWGAIEWALASRLSPIRRHLHFEAGFGPEESNAQIRRRVLFRRWALARCSNLVVPSRTLERLAREIWRIPAERVTYVPNGVDLNRFSEVHRKRVPEGMATEEPSIGTVAPLRPEKNLGRLLHAFAMLGASIPARLVIAGNGPERDSLQSLAVELGIAQRVRFTGQVVPEQVLHCFDIFALSSDTEQMPNAVLEAMAASLAIAAVDVGDVKEMVSEANRAYIVERDDVRALATVMAQLLKDPTKRKTLGRDNRERAVAKFSQEQMFAAYGHILGAD
jgi:glycosyltransferase involved in cell wall biosynthesis